MGSASHLRRPLAAIGIASIFIGTALAWQLAAQEEAPDAPGPAVAEKASGAIDTQPIGAESTDTPEAAPVDAVPVAASDRAAVATVRRRKGEVRLDGEGRAVAVRLSADGPLTGELIGAVARLRSLRELNLAGTRVDSDGLSHLRGLSRLRSLDLAFTAVGDDGLAAVARLRGLRSLNLHGTPITDAGLKHLRRLAGLTTLVLQRTAITDAGLPSLRGLTRLETLSLVNTAVGPDGLAHLRPLARLRHLGLAGTRITDAGLVHLKSFKNLESLSLSATAIGNVGLKVFREDLAAANPSGLTALQTLRLSFCPAVTDVGLEHLHDLRQLRSLSLRGTGVSPKAAAALENTVPGCDVRY
jgi:hypothetical protein